jgi:nickel-dependent lactate racemase
MPTEEIYAGRKFAVQGWVDNEKLLIREFLDELAENRDGDAERLRNLIVRVADEGVTHNQQHVRPLDTNIFEFKGSRTGRILFFYDKGQLIICSHGFKGKSGNEMKRIAKEIRKANRIREDYFDEKRTKR